MHDQQGVQASVKDQEEELCGGLKVKEKKKVSTMKIKILFINK